MSTNRKITPLTGQAYLDYLKLCVAVVASWPSWVKGRTVNKDETLYYIKTTGYVGNSLIWWRDGGHGYTCNLKHAWKVTRKKAEAVCRPGQDEPIPVRVADDLATPQVDSQALWDWQRQQERGARS